jgi:hypothetical protein
MIGVKFLGLVGGSMERRVLWELSLGKRPQGQRRYKRRVWEPASSLKQAIQWIQAKGERVTVSTPVMKTVTMTDMS